MEKERKVNLLQRSTGTPIIEETYEPYITGQIG